MLGYFLCLAVLTPALSLDVFFSLLGKTPRQHDVLGVFSTLLQLFATVTSPFRIAFTLAVFLFALVIESNWLQRALALVMEGVDELGCALRCTLQNRTCLCVAC
jgi:hypothetical protein